MRAIKEVNEPKFLESDLILFNGIVSDLFPTTQYNKTKHNSLEMALAEVCNERNIIPTEKFIKKCIELYETKVIRHGLMLVGPAGSGKSTVNIFKCFL